MLSADEKRARNREKSARYRAKNPEKVRAWDRARYAKNPQASQARVAAYRKAKPRCAVQDAARRIGLSREELPPKPERCPLCESPTRISMDHDHTSGKFRGWICGACNSALGYARDNPALLRKLADYLERT